MKASDLAVAVRAVHMVVEHYSNFGIKPEGCICAGAKISFGRQTKGFRRLLKASRTVLLESPLVDGSQKHVHLTYAHMWDEVNCKFRRTELRTESRFSKMAVDQQLIMRRGAFNTTLIDSEAKRSAQYPEDWLVKPMHVRSADADSLRPAISKACPPGLSLDDLSELMSVLDSCSGLTLIPVGEKASGSLLIQKGLG